MGVLILKEKTFLFVNLAVDCGFFGVNHGIAYLVHIIRKNGFNVSVINIVKDITAEEFKKQIESLNPLIVGYSFMSLQVKYLIKYSKVIQNLSLLQIAGGVGATLEPETILQTSVDGFVIGEGEIPLDSLLKTINQDGNIYNTKGFCWQKDGELIKNEIPQYLNNLDQFDFPDYSVFDRKIVIYDLIYDIQSINSNINIMLSRGCPYACPYCSNKAIRSVYPSSKNYFRIPSVKYSINLLENLIKQYPESKHISFEDDLLTANKEWFWPFAEEYRKRIRLPYRVNIRTETLNTDIVKALKESGCVTASIGIESGNEELRKKVLKRHASNKEIIEKSKMIKKAGIKLYTYNMIGIPFETKEQMRDTLILNRKIGADFGQSTFFCPFPGTELYEICKKYSLLKESEVYEISSNYVDKPFIIQTSEQEKQTLKAQERILDYFKWQSMKYKQRNLRLTCSNPIAVWYYSMRLLAIYFIKKFSSPKNKLYWWIVDSKLKKQLDKTFQKYR